MLLSKQPTAENACRSETLLWALAVCMFLGAAGAQTAMAQQTVRYGTAGTSLSHAPPLVAGVAPEVFASHGIRLELTDFRGNSSNCITAVISGAIDVCQVGTTSGTDAIAEGANLKAIAITTRQTSEIILSAKTVAALGVRPDAPIDDRLRALKGLRIVTTAPGTASYVIFGVMLKRVGLSPADIKFRTLGEPIAMMESIRHDQIDGAVFGAGALSGVLMDKAGVRWISVPRGDVPELRGVPFVTAYAKAVWVDANAALVSRLHGALSDAITALKKEPARYSKLLKARYAPDLEQALWDDSYQQSMLSLLDGAKAPGDGWAALLKMQSESSKKDYSRAAFDKVVVPAAQSGG